MNRQLQSGKGWRLGWNPEAEKFCGLVGADDWAIELTAPEFHDFCRLAQQLHQTMTAMADQLMEEEHLSCEQETEILWIEAEGFPAAYSLRFMLLTDRRGEGAWRAIAVPELIIAIQNIGIDDDLTGDNLADDL